MRIPDIDVLLILQVGITVVLIGAYSAFTAYRQDEAYRLSDLQTATAVRILIDDHPDIRELADIIEARPGFDVSRHIAYTATTLALVSGGPIKGREEYYRGAVQVYGFLLFPQILVWIVPVYLRDEMRARYVRIETTAVRRNDMAKESVALVGSVGYLAAGGAVIGAVGWLGYVLLALSAVGFLGSISAALITVKAQVDWKIYWRDRLSEVVLVAVRNDRQATASRAMLAKQDVDVAPFAPLPAALGFYIATFSVTQAALLGLSKAFE